MSAALALALAIAGAPGSADLIERTGKDVTLRWTERVPTSLAKVREALLKRPRDAVSGLKSLKARAKSAGLHLVVETPFFLPKIWFDVAVAERARDDEVIISWRRTAGTSERYRRRWTLRAVAGGTEVSHLCEMQIPFDLPDLFAKGKLQQQIDGDKARLRLLAAP